MILYCFEIIKDTYIIIIHLNCNFWQGSWWIWNVKINNSFNNSFCSKFELALTQESEKDTGRHKKLPVNTLQLTNEIKANTYKSIGFSMIMTVNLIWPTMPSYSYFGKVLYIPFLLYRWKKVLCFWPDHLVCLSLSVYTCVCLSSRLWRDGCT